MITLKGQPLSTNTLYKSVCRGNFPSVYMTSNGKTLKEDYAYQVKKQWKEEMIKGSVTVSLVFFHKTKRKADIDNFNKLILDSLSGVVFEDDSQIIEMYLRKEYDSENPRVTIEVTEL